LLFFYLVSLGVLLVSGSWLLGSIGAEDGEVLFVSERFFLGLMLACVTLLALVIVWVIRPLYRSVVASHAGSHELMPEAEGRDKVSQLRVRTALGILGGFGEGSGNVPMFGHSVAAFKSAVDCAAVSIMITDVDARIVYVNDAFLRQTGYAREELLGRDAGVMKSGRTRREVYQELWKTIRSGRSWRGELVNRRRGGTEYWEQLAIAPLRDPNGAISHFVAVREDITERRKREDALHQLAHIDVLTGVGNRRYLMERAENELRRAERFGLALSLLILDIDRFKQINDCHGHSCGDQAIRLVAQCCVEHVRDIDFVGRFGGEEFVAVMPGTALNGAREVAERLRKAVSALSLECGVGKTFGLTVSVGIAELIAGDKLEQVFASADAALYRAKGLGRNRVVAVTDVFDESETGLDQ
jgi:diguanylate cyclase (GGDEF)-like protein/PAS domain S-box-containing protein